MTTIVAHRGAPKSARENTIESFLAAMALGAEMIELDVRRTADGVPVVFHDAFISRRTPTRLIKNMTFSELNKRTSRRGFSVPSLEQAFSALRGKARLDIELKEPGYEEEVVALTHSHFEAHEVIFSSFDPSIIASVKAAAPQFATGFILAGSDALPLCTKAAADFLAPHHRLFRTRHDFFADARKSGVRIAVWTVDDTQGLARLLVDPIVDAIITNRPDKALALRKKLGCR